MSAGTSKETEPPDKPSDSMSEANTVENNMETSDQEESIESAGEGVNNTDNQTENGSEVQSYAQAASSESSGEHTVIVDVLRIVLKKTKPGANYYLKHKEKAKLVFMQLGVPRHHVVGIDQEDFRTIRVHMNCAAAQWKVAHSIEIKDGLITLPMRMFRRLTTVTVSAGVDTRPIEVTTMLNHFGTFETMIDYKLKSYYEDADISKLTLEEKMMRGVRNGDIEVKMFIKKHIPSFALLGSGKRVRVRYPAQPVTCARCHQGIRGCRGGANAARCEKKGGVQVPLQDFWKTLIAPAEGERREAEQGQEEAEIPGNVLRIEGLGKSAGKEWVRLYLNIALDRFLDDVDMVQSENKLAWEVTGLSPEEIQSILQKVAGTQFKGKTVYCAPVVKDVNVVNTDASPSEPGTGEENEGENSSNKDEKSDKEDPSNSQGEEDFEKVERRKKSAEKKERARKAKEQGKKEEEAEKELQKNLSKGGKKTPEKGNVTSRRGKRNIKDTVSPGKTTDQPETRLAKKSKDAAAQGSSSSSSQQPTQT